MSVVLRRLADRLRTEERGLSLVELLVAMTLGLLVLTIAGSFLVSSQKAAVTATSTSANTRAASVAMNEMGRMLRAATDNPVPTGDDSQFAFQYASATSLRFFAYVNLDSTLSQPVEVQLTLDPATKRITETTWKGQAVANNTSYFAFPLGSGPTLAATPTTQRTLVSSAVNATAFSYRKTDGSPLTITGSALAPTDLPNIRAVTMAVTVGSSSADPNAVTLSSTASLPNIVMGASS
ncbi:prepilin-type N-terminal cleavage/methylation domain-containing protein [Curtobacterium sp. MCSS17_007]|uniref:prepilin-type N-terminal cleavage/methylation domain-containing protein n=1 Tax=Curtobacterium sp. MCSS17_007 TaxID=2175646 RepID=UPI0015E8959B|nr:prepilin-type N-terminal cleavage/methylation domain-containing protein [Curtobacterium sp. MCSS17_007]WIE75485.1 prepilin-type N-terminal cleavage/methylation domain-containing protein [Curtobacterium sp. MCSS17_007]